MCPPKLVPFFRSLTPVLCREYSYTRRILPIQSRRPDFLFVIATVYIPLITAMSLFQIAFDYAAPFLYVGKNELPIDLQVPSTNHAYIQPYKLPHHILCRPDLQHSSYKKLRGLLIGYSSDYADFIDPEVRSQSTARRAQNVDIFRIFFWFGEHYSITLLTQAIVMVVVQITLLKVALDNRPSAGVRNGIEHTPFSGGNSDGSSSRPYEFWQWKTTKP